MLTIICGEDTAASRTYFVALQNDYKNKGYEITPVKAQDLEQVVREDETPTSLFSNKHIYTVENLTSILSRSKKKNEFVEDIIKSQTIELIDWEGNKSGREIKLKPTTLKDFKLDQSIFQFVEACYPGNLTSFVKMLWSLNETQEEGFIFAMLARQIRTLVLAKSDALGTMPFWMKNKLVSQANKWDEARLIGFYENLARIDQNLKTSSDLYGISKTLELLACHYLK